MIRIRRHLSYANVTATLALVLALGTGAVYAAGGIGSRQIVNNSVRSQDVRNDALIGADLRRNTLGGREISEQSLVGTKLVALAGDQDGDCDPGPSAFVDCAAATVDLAQESQLLAVVTGGFSSEADGANAKCDVRIDDQEPSLFDIPGEVTDNSDVSATDGFARTLVTGTLDAGQHKVALACQQLGPEDARIRAPTIAVLAVTAD